MPVSRYVQISEGAEGGGGVSTTRVLPTRALSPPVVSNHELTGINKAARRRAGAHSQMRHTHDDGVPSPSSHAMTFDFGDKFTAKMVDGPLAKTGGPKPSRKYKATHSTANSNSVSMVGAPVPPPSTVDSTRHAPTAGQALEDAAAVSKARTLNPVMSSRSLKPIAVLNEMPPEPLPSFAPLTHKKAQAGGMDIFPLVANGPKSKASKSQSGRTQGVTVPTVCTSLEGLPVDFRRTGAPSPPPAAVADTSGVSIATILDPTSAKERTLLPIAGKRSTKGALVQNTYVFSSSPPPDKDVPSQQQPGRDEKVRWATTRNPPKTKVTKSLQQQYTSARNTTKPANNNIGGGDEAGNNGRHVDIQPSVVSGKQWEFKMPDAPEPTITPNPLEGLESAGAPVNTSSGQLENTNNGATLETSLGGNKNVRFQKPAQRNIVGPHIRTQGGKMAKPVQRTTIKGRAQVPSGSIFEMVVAGQHRLGTFDDDTATTYTLASLESAVARQRRLREEIANVQKQVLSGFRSVVRTFVAYQSVHVDTPLQTLSALDGAKLSNTQKTIKKGAFTFSIPLAKCSVVVHTLATTIQRYARFRHSNALVGLIQKGNNKLEAARSLASRSMGVAPLDASALLSLAPYTPSHDGDRSVSSAWSENLRHEEVLDSNTIAQLKQLYFAYYDCESYVLDFADDTSPTAKRLSMGGNDANDVHNVIEEANVLVAGFEEMEADVEEQEVVGGEGSMMFNEAKEWNQIYSDEDERSSSGSSISCDYVDDDVPSDIEGPEHDDEDDISERHIDGDGNSPQSIYPPVNSSIISAPKLAVRHRQAAHPPPQHRHVSPPRDGHSSSTIECCDVVEETPVRTAGSSKGFRSLRWQRPSRESSQAPAILSDEEVVDEAV